MKPPRNASDDCDINDKAGLTEKVARQWFEKAAALGIPKAKQNLRQMRR
jgi:hypothetical protein